MRLDAALSGSASGLDSISRQLALVSQNVANASTPGYVRETVALSSLDAGNGLGVRTGVATRDVDTALQGSVFDAGAAVEDGQTRQTALAAVDAASGTPGSGQDVSSLLGALRDAFSTLLTDPADATQQRTVVSAAGTLARGINGIGAAITTARQAVQDQLGDDVAQANAALQTIGTLGTQIVAARGRGDSTADLEDKRDTAMATVASLTGARFLRQADGDVLAFSGGIVLPTRAGTGPLAIGAATLAPDTPAAAVPALTVGGIVSGIAGGRIGAELAVRDTVLPERQSALDSFAQSLASGFAQAGVPLFGDATGTVPPAGTAGFAQGIAVTAAATATPSLVRDGTAAPTTAGNTAVITGVLGSVLATGAGTVAAQASGLVADTANLAAQAADRLTVAQGVQTGLTTRLTASTGVSVDSELTGMVSLQSSYAANAKVVAAVQAMWTQLLQSFT